MVFTFYRFISFVQSVQACPDSANANLWYSLGTEACKSNQYLLARSAFERVGSMLKQVFKVLHSIFKGSTVSDNWLCRDKLIAVYFILGDYASINVLHVIQCSGYTLRYVGCLSHISEMLQRFPAHRRSMVLRRDIVRKAPHLKQYFPHLCPVEENLEMSDADKKVLGSWPIYYVYLCN